MARSGDRSRGAQADSSEGAGGRRVAGPVALIVEAGGPAGAAMEARLAADGAIRCERATAVEHAGPLAAASGATVILLLPGNGPDRFETMANLYEGATAGLPIVVIDEASSPADRRAAFAAGASDYWAGWPDPMEARARLLALSRGVVAERQRDEAQRELAGLRTRLADAQGRLARGQDLDEATGLPSKRRLIEQLDVEWRRARRGGGALSLVMIEIERPGGGPRTGEDEERFVAVATALRGVLRRGGDLLARFSEGQLAAALPEVGPEGAAAVAQTLRHAAVAVDPTLRFTTGIVTRRPQEATGEGSATLIAEAEASLARAR